MRTLKYLAALVSCWLILLLATPVQAVTLGGLNTMAGKAGYNLAGGSILDITGSAIGLILSFVGVIFLFLIIYAGFIWMTAAGDPKPINKAKDMLFASCIGLLIVLVAYVVAYYFGTGFQTASGQ